MRSGSLDQTTRRAALTLILVAFVARLLVPIGWMPAERGFAIQLCTGQGVTTAWMSMDGDVRDHPPEGHPAAKQPCAFAALLPFDDAPPFAIVPPLPPAADLVAALVPGVVSPGRGLAAPPPPARGPPVRV